MPKIWAALAASFVLFILFFALGPIFFRGAEPARYVEGKNLSSFSSHLLDSQGKKVWVKNLPLEADKKKVLSFWASWCAPCVVEIPLILKAEPILKNKNIEVVMINEDPGEFFKVEPEIRAWKISKNLKFDTLYDENSRFFTEIKATALPFHVGIVGGDVVWSAEGEIDWNPVSIEKRFLKN